MAAKIILVTGASAGFGKNTAKLFLQNGYKVILCGRRREKLIAAIKGYEDQAHILCFDIQKKMEVDKAIDSLPKEFRKIDVLVNNAGLALGTEPACESKMDDWETMIDTNIKGLLYITKKILPEMVALNSGYIINIGSIAGTWPYQGGNTYGATKAFVRQFSLNLRADLLGTKVRITNVAPGLAETEFSIVRYHGDKTKADQVYNGCDPLVGEDIADIIKYLVETPDHVNINSLEVMPTCQSFAGFSIHRD